MNEKKEKVALAGDGWDSPPSDPIKDCIRGGSKKIVEMKIYKSILFWLLVSFFIVAGIAMHG